MDYSIQAPSTTVLADQWSVDSQPVFGEPETTESGWTGTDTWDTTAFAKFDTYSGPRVDGSLGLTIGSFENYGTFQTTQTYPIETLTPAGGIIADTSTGKPQGVVATGAGSSQGSIALGSSGSGAKKIDIPADADSPSDAGEGGSFARQMEQATAAAGEPVNGSEQMAEAASQVPGRDVAQKQAELTGDGKTGMTVDPQTGDVVSLQELSQADDYKFNGEANLEAVMARSREAYAAGKRPVISTGKTEQPAKLSLKSYTLTEDVDKQTSTETKLLGTADVEAGASEQTYTGPQLIDSEEKIISVTPHTRYTDEKTTLADQWVQKTLMDTSSETTVTGGETASGVKTWVEMSDPVIKDNVPSVEKNPDNPQQERKVTVRITTQAVTTYEQDVTSVSEKTERTVVKDVYDVKEYAKYRTDTAVTTDGVTQVSDPVYDTVLLSEKTETEENVMNKVIAPASENLGEVRSSTQTIVLKYETIYGEWYAKSSKSSSGGGSSSSSSVGRYAVSSSDGSFSTTDDRQEAGKRAEHYASHLPSNSSGNKVGSVNIVDTQSN
jgi:hypothetical protein